METTTQEQHPKTTIPKKELEEMKPMASMMTWTVICLVATLLAGVVGFAFDNPLESGARMLFFVLLGGTVVVGLTTLAKKSDRLSDGSTL